MKKKKEAEKHNKYYYEKGRNGWTPTTTAVFDDRDGVPTMRDTTPDDLNSKERKESPQKDSKVDLKSYVNELEKYVSEMEQFIHGVDESCNVSSCSESINVKQGDFATILDAVTKEITDLLKSKNKAYGNTALNPPRIFSKLNSTEALCARLDDKLSRIKNRGINDDTEDTLDDVIGYLLLLKMSLK
tara:strand:- start:1573 stop:2133 length:561 start_codon:yes stop_codon:yes gene_type:complete